MRGRLPYFVLFAVALVPACSGAAPSDLLATGGSVDVGTTSSSGGSGSSSGGKVDAASPQPDAGNNSSSSSSSGGSVPDASTTIDATAPIESGPPAQSVFCGDNSPECTSPEVCCATAAGNGNPPAVTFACTDPSQCAQGAIIECSSTADCPGGDVCCGEDLNGVYSQVTCTPQCTGTTSTGASEVQLCDPNANDCPTATPTCQKSGVLTGYYVCR